MIPIMVSDPTRESVAVMCGMIASTRCCSTEYSASTSVPTVLVLVMLLPVLLLWKVLLCSWKNMFISGTTMPAAAAAAAAIAAVYPRLPLIEFVRSLFGVFVPVIGFRVGIGRSFVCWCLTVGVFNWAGWVTCSATVWTEPGSRTHVLLTMVQHSRRIGGRLDCQKDVLYSLSPFFPIHW